MNSKKRLERRLTRKMERETKSLNYRTKRIWKIDREVDANMQYQLAERGE